MLKNIRWAGLALLLFACVLSSSGCFLILGAAAGVGGYAYVSGVLEKGYNVSAQDLQNATKLGLRDLKLVIESQESDRLTAKLRSTLADGNAVKIDINSLTEKSSKIRIRVGIVGDKSKSEMILNAIETHL